MLEFRGTFHYATDRAIKVDFDGNGEGCWLPRSQIEECAEDIDTLGEGDLVSVEVPEWLAIEKGLV